MTTAGQTTTGMMEAALELAENGFAVFPLVSKDKNPQIKGWQKKATADTEQIRAWWKKWPDANIGILCGSASHGVVVIDVDRKHGVDGFVELEKWQKEHGSLPPTLCANSGTGGGMHMYYRAAKPLTKYEGKVGIDLRAEGSYIVAPPSTHPNGRAYEWQIPFNTEMIAAADENTLAFIEAMRVEGKKKDNNSDAAKTGGAGDSEIQEMNAEAPLLELIQQDTGEAGRDNGEYIAFKVCPVCGHNDDFSYVRAGNYWQCFGGSNATGKRGGGYSDYLMAAHNMTASEAIAELRRVTNHPRKPKSAASDSKGRFDHSELGDVLINDYHAKVVDGFIVIWDTDNCRYWAGEEAIERALIAERRNITRAQRKETISYIRLQAERCDLADPKYIAFNNGVLNIETMELCPPSPDFVLPNVIPHRWNPSANCEELKAAIRSWACNDAGRAANIVETIGLCMYRGRDITACPVIVGRGSNGKSTFLNFLHRIIGDENVSSLDLAIIGKRFQSTALIGKLANIADDIPSTFVDSDSMATWRKAITGDYVTAEIKGGELFKFRPYCRFVISANEMPRLGDSTDGVFRRFTPVVFGARFSVQDGTAKTRLERTLDTEAAYEFAIYLGVMALRKCIENGRMRETADQLAVIGDMRRQNSSVVSFVEDSYIDPRGLVGLTTEQVYAEYVRYCEDAGESPNSRANRNRFAAEIKLAYNLDTARRRVAGHQQAVFIERA